MKESFYKELELVSDKFPIYRMKKVKIGKEHISKPTTGNESLHEISNDNGVGVEKFATFKNLIFKSTMFPHRNIHNFTWTSPDGKSHNQI
jgi:hypothetical protein